MHERLRNLIERFREAQDEAVSFYVNFFCPRFGLRLPTSRDDWANMIQTVERGPYAFDSGEGIELLDFGIEFRLLVTDLTQDSDPHFAPEYLEYVVFDWGDKGETDGFDGPQLQLFGISNPTELASPSLFEISEWIQHARFRGDLICDASLYYSPLHRARRR